MFPSSTGSRSFVVPTRWRMNAASPQLSGLPSFGYELRRPLADMLRNGVYELRIRKGRVNYRILYFFHGKDTAILGHALTKEDRVPPAEIERAMRRKQAFEASPSSHTWLEEI